MSLHRLKLLMAPRVTPTPEPSEPMGLAGTPDPTVDAGAAYSFVPTVTGDYVEPLTFSLDGELPPGWDFDPATGEISRTPI